jgi:hypothetical protein
VSKSEDTAYYRDFLAKRGEVFNRAFVPKSYRDIDHFDQLYRAAEAAAAKEQEKAAAKLERDARKAAEAAEEKRQQPKARGADGSRAITQKNLQRHTEVICQAVVKFMREERIKLERRIEALEAQQVKHAGTWRAGMSYRKGNLVSHDGSGWIATRDHPGKPGAPNSGFTLFVKKGRDAK